MLVVNLVETDKSRFLSSAGAYRQKLSKNYFFRLRGTLKRIFSLKYQLKIFFTTTILSLYYCICEKVKGGRKTKGLQGIDWPEGDDKQMVELSNILK